MIRAINLADEGEAFRIDVTKWANSAIRLDADETSSVVVEVKKAIGETGEAHSFDTPIILSELGTSITPIDCHRCTHLVIEVTTAGVGLGQVEHQETGLIYGRFELVEISANDEGFIWDHPINPLEQLASIVIDMDQTAAVSISFCKSVDIEGQLISTDNLAINGDITEVEAQSVSRVGLECLVAVKGRRGMMGIYWTSPRSFAGLPEEMVAYLDRSQVFEGGNLFAGAFQIGNLSTGLHTISSSSAANRAIDIPDSDGEIAIVSDPSPADEEILIRSGDGYDSVPVAGSSFPASPFDGQRFTRTDLDLPEEFYWDDTRGKWLGELLPFVASRSAAASSGSLDLRGAGGQQFSSARAWAFNNPMTIVKCSMFSAANWTGDVDIFEGSSKITTMLSPSNERAKHDDSLNINIDGDSQWPPKYPKIQNISGGNCSNPYVIVYLRRNGTAI